MRSVRGQSSKGVTHRFPDVDGPYSLSSVIEGGPVIDLWCGGTHENGKGKGKGGRGGRKKR
jgi:hypothetical protein